MTPEQAEALRKAFPKGSVGKLPKGGMMLDYVGHAAVVDRLLSVDPEWTWEPLALDDAGLPAIDQAGNLWIRLTIAGVTRIGCGDGKNMKERIGDALRNAAMRFGVALDLWSKEELESGHAEDKPGRPNTTVKTPDPKVLSPKERVWVHAKGASREARLDWVTGALEARGLDIHSESDLAKLADELDGVAA